MKGFIDKDFHVPEILTTDRLLLRMLTIQDVVKDYEAVMTSIGHLRETRPFGPDNNWPSSDLTFEQDLIDLGWHQKEFQKRSSFAYTVMDLNETCCLGCVYIYPSRNPRHDAMVILWVRESEVANGLDDHLFHEVKQWLDRSWPFRNPGYPGRNVTWETWNSHMESDWGKSPFSS